MNRGVIEWAMLYLGVANALVGLVSLGHVPIFFILFNFFVFGMGFEYWLIGGQVSVLLKLARGILKTNYELIGSLRESAKKIEELEEKKKVSKKK